MYTSAKTCLTSAMFWIRICDRDRHQNFTICSLVHCQPSLKISCKCIWKFLCKAANRDRQTEKQMNNDKNITSLAEVIMRNNRTNTCCTIKTYNIWSDFLWQAALKTVNIKQSSVCKIVCVWLHYVEKHVMVRCWPSTSWQAKHT